ncbi:MAG: penicillin-binding protein 2 [Anaerolineales bacterium]|nr:penicillin-binding protein 2 [Anaerolineales bacterium]
MKIAQPAPAWRTGFFFGFLAVAALGLLLRAFWLTVIENPQWAAEAVENRVSRVSDPAPRGIIYDARGVPLVLNVPSFNVVVVPANLPDSEAQTERIYQRLADLLNMPITVPGSTPQAACTQGTGPNATRGVRDLVEEGAGFRPFDAVKVGCDVTKEIALVVREEKDQLPGVDVVVEPLRQYPTGELTAALVGYMAAIPSPDDAPLTYAYLTGRGFVPGRDRYGVAGIEASMQDELGGQNGSSLVEKDVSGQVLRVLGVETATVPGNNVQLTIDVRLQNAAFAAVQHRIDYVNAFNNYAQNVQVFTGVAIVMNPRTGQVLAMVSWPTYDNNRFARSIDLDYYEELAGQANADVPADPYYPLLNHAVNVLYPPGSVFKVVTAVGALEENVIEPERFINDPGKITIRDQYFPADLGRARDFVCWNRQGHGEVNFITGIAQSCNVYFYKIGGGYPDDGIVGLGIERLGKWMNLFGFGETTGIELPGELAGYIPSRDRKRITWGESWSTGDTYNAVIGQGYVSVTPLQMLNAYNAVINGGWLYKPTIIDKILDGEGNVITQYEPQLLSPERLPISQTTLDYVRTGMRKAVVDGTLSGDLNVYGQIGVPKLDLPEDLHVAGKTGTAEFCDKFAWPRGWCIPGTFPTHAWTTLYAPYEDPEVSVIVFVYHGGEGSLMAAPIAGEILRAYFELKAQDAGAGN